MKFSRRVVAAVRRSRQSDHAMEEPASGASRRRIREQRTQVSAADRPKGAARKVLSWKVSITMDVHFCLEALEEAIALHGAPDIMNTDQGSQFTSQAFSKIRRDLSSR